MTFLSKFSDFILDTGEVCKDDIITYPNLKYTTFKFKIIRRLGKIFDGKILEMLYKIKFCSNDWLFNIIFKCPFGFHERNHAVLDRRSCWVCHKKF